MNWLKAIGYGFLYFCVIFVIGSIAMFGLKLTGDAMGIVMLISAVIVLWILAGQYKIGSLNDGIQIGLVWVIVDALLEYLVIVQIFNKGVASGFYNWSVLLGYALVIIIPAYVGQSKKG